MAKTGCVLHAGMVLDCDGYLAETSEASNCAQMGGSEKSWSEIFLSNGGATVNNVNPTDSDAYVYDNDGNLYIVKSPCPQKLTCKYSKGSNVKLINSTNGIWSKEIDCRESSGSTTPSTASSAVSMVTVYVDYNDTSANPRIGNNANNYIDFYSQSSANGDVVCRYDFVKWFDRYSSYDGHPLETGNGRFKGCTQLTECNLLCSMIEISEDTFSGCTSLRKYTNTNFVKSIDDRAFKGCTSLQNIVIGPHVTSIGNEAFSGCSSAENLMFKYGDTSSTYCNGLSGLSNYAFAQCTSLTRTSFPKSGQPSKTYNGILIPENITSIGEGCFKLCSGIEGLSGEGITYIGDGAFQACSSLSSLKLPKVTKIGDYAFQLCGNLTSINIASGASGSSEIIFGQKAFHQCASLTSVTIGKDDCSITFNATSNSEVFAFCDSLSVITLKHKTKDEYNNDYHVDLSHMFDDISIHDEPIHRTFYVPNKNVYESVYSSYPWEFRNLNND